MADWRHFQRNRSQENYLQDDLKDKTCKCRQQDGAGTRAGVLLKGAKRQQSLWRCRAYVATNIVQSNHCSYQDLLTQQRHHGAQEYWLLKTDASKLPPSATKVLLRQHPLSAAPKKGVHRDQGQKEIKLKEQKKEKDRKKLEEWTTTRFVETPISLHRMSSA